MVLFNRGDKRKVVNPVPEKASYTLEDSTNGPLMLTTNSKRVAESIFYLLKTHNEGAELDAGEGQLFRLKTIKTRQTFTLTINGDMQALLKYLSVNHFIDAPAAPEHPSPQGNADGEQQRLLSKCSKS